MTPEFVDLIKEKLALDWSPEQISGRLQLEEIYISHEAIYRYVRKDHCTKAKVRNIRSR